MFATGISGYRIPIWAFIFVSIWLTAVSPAHCDETDSPDAKLLFNEGVSHYNKKEYEIAADLFQRAYDAKPSWKLLFNIGQAQAASKRYGLAIQAFEGYLIDGGDNVSVERQETTVAEIERLRLLVGLLSITAPDGLEVVVNGAIRGTTPFSAPLQVAVGTHTVEFIRSGEIIYETSVSIGSGITTAITYEEDAVLSQPLPTVEPTSTETPDTEPAANNDGTADIENSPAPASPPPLQNKMTPKLVTGIILGGAGIVSVGLGTAFAVAAGKSYQAAQDEQYGDQTAFDADYSDFESRRVGAIVGFVAGGVLLAVGGTLITLELLNKRKKRASRASLSSIGATITF
ncbi:MAG: hypothetical protein JXX29_09725 [Deltaproteobacteria bacterium]|nr:hypothetical protein [Deltaproteobacteria bacterium]MBN2671944.1 hypothetical protein [Deltaproteobacteria bacterium]